MTVAELDHRTICDAVGILESGSRVDHRGRETRDAREYAAGRVRVDIHARMFYSYGRHFPLARYVPRAGRHGPLWLINGDSWNGSNSRTRDHQSSTRDAIATGGLPSIVLPFSALEGAGINPDSVRPIHVRPDSEWTETLTADTIDDIPHHRRRNGPGPDSWQYRESAGGTFEWTETRHRLGDALFSAVRMSQLTRPARPFESDSETPQETVECPAPGERHCHAAAAATDNRSDLHEAGPSGACIHCSRELTARVTSRHRTRFLSSFDYQEISPLYFLAQVPRGAGDTVEAAIESLAPRAVHAARARGRRVYRQGDVFFVETDLTRDALEERGATFARLTQWTRSARPRLGEAGYRPPLDAAGRRREQRYRARLWRQTFRDAVDRATSGETTAARPSTDHGARARWVKIRAAHADAVEGAWAELRRATLAGPRRRAYRSYYESQLVAERRTHADAVRSARARLEQLLADGPRDSNGNTSRAHGRDAYRRLYGRNALTAWTRAQHDAAQRYRPHELEGSDVWRARRDAARRILAIYGTAHAATETARVPGGGFYAAGTVRHVPDLEPGRDGGRDHRPLELPAGSWYLALRNRVPRQ